MRRRVLSVAYPFAPVDADPVGGAEQVLAALDRALVRRGWDSEVIAAAGSSVAGRLHPLAVRPTGEIDEASRRAVHVEVRERIAAVCREVAPDLVHLHGIDFADYLPPPGVPVLVTLHLPLDWYGAQAWRAVERPRTWLLPVSAHQAGRAPAQTPFLLAPIDNGVDLQRFRPQPRRKAGFALGLGRICPEKGFHLAMDTARALGLRFVLAGSVFPYPEHRRYFEEEIAPRLGGRARWLGPVGGEAKVRLLSAARLLVVASLAPETSSLVAREAMACATPVVALRGGALDAVIAPGRTGELADGPAELACAMAQALRLDGRACRTEAQARFDLQATTDAYLRLYARLASVA